MTTDLTFSEFVSMIYVFRQKLQNICGETIIPSIEMFGDFSGTFHIVPLNPLQKDVDIAFDSFAEMVELLVELSKLDGPTSLEELRERF